MDGETIHSLYAWANDKLKQELALRQVRCRANANKAAVIDLLIADMIRNRAAALSGARSSGKISVESSGEGKGKSSSSGNMSVDFPFGFDNDYHFEYTKGFKLWDLIRKHTDCAPASAGTI